MIIALAVMIIGAAAVFNIYREVQRQEILKETSVTLGDWNCL